MWKVNFIFAGITLCFIYLKVDQVDGGECCQTYYDALNIFYGEQWCPDYCCQDLPGSLRLFCCSDRWKRAPGRYRQGYCSSWWTYRTNIWAPIVVSIVLLAIVIGICICIVQCCCVCF